MATEDQAERQQRRKRIYVLDTALNWILVAVVAFSGYLIIETDVDTYQGERLFFHMLNDGVTFEEAAESPYMEQGMRRNMQYKGVSSTDFFIAKWKWRFPIYITCIFLPLFVAFFRALSKDRRRWTWAYIPLIILNIGYSVYYAGRWKGWW